MRKSRTVPGSGVRILRDARHILLLDVLLVMAIVAALFYWFTR